MTSSCTRSRARTTGWTSAVRGPWTVVRALAMVVLGPAAVTASALEQANAAPLYHAVKAHRTQACIPSGPSRRRTVV